MSASTPSLAQCRARAHELLRHFRADDPRAALAAAVRLVRLRSFADRTPDQLLADRTNVRLKHALAVVAEEAGAASWAALRERIAAAAPAPATIVGRTRPTSAADVHSSRLTVYLNRWFADYDEARESLAHDGGYLLPFRDQFYITSHGGVLELGLDPDDPDWERIGFDWIRPRDADAHARLVEQWLAVRDR